MLKYFLGRVLILMGARDEQPKRERAAREMRVVAIGGGGESTRLVRVLARGLRKTEQNTMTSRAWRRSARLLYRVGGGRCDRRTTGTEWPVAGQTCVLAR